MIRLSPRRSFTLYGLVVLFVFVAFLLGLLIGTENTRPAELRPVESTFEPVEDLENQLDFYEELSKPIEEVQNQRPTVILEKSPKPEEAAEPGREEPPPSSESDAGVKPFTVQVAALSTREEAEQLLIRLSSRSFEGRIHSAATGADDRYFRVWVGEFSSFEEAESYAVQLKEAGFPTYIRKIL